MSAQLSNIRQQARKLGLRGARSLWDGMTKEQRSREMKRRRRLGIARKKGARSRENTASDRP